MSPGMTEADQARRRRRAPLAITASLNDCVWIVLCGALVAVAL
jgi:hypothetical protein